MPSLTFWDAIARHAAKDIWVHNGLIWLKAKKFWHWDGDQWVLDFTALIGTLDTPKISVVWVPAANGFLDAPTIEVVWTVINPPQLDAPTIIAEWANAEIDLDAPTIAVQWIPDLSPPLDPPVISAEWVGGETNLDAPTIAVTWHEDIKPVLDPPVIIASWSEPETNLDVPHIVVSWHEDAKPVLDMPTIAVIWSEPEVDLDAPTISVQWHEDALPQLDQPVVAVSWFSTDSGTLDAPTITAEWDDVAAFMKITITPGANNPPDTVYVINATGSGSGGTTNSTEFDDAVNPQDHSQSCYTAVATHPDYADSAPSNEACALRGTLGTLSVPTISASYDTINQRMIVNITPGANNPADTTFVITGTGSGASGSTTSHSYIDAVNPQDGSQSCYTCVATHADWNDSPASNQTCANRGTIGVLDTPSIVASWDFDNHVMIVTITPGANNPSGTTRFFITAVSGTSATGGSTLSTTYTDGVNPEDGTNSCYTCHASATSWTASPESAQACATRGNAT